MNRLMGIMSGEHRDPSAVLLRAAGQCAVPFYAAAVALRNRAFDAGLKKTHRAHCPVISIGNLTTGGTGKTPMAILITKQLQHLGATPAIVLRGYKADESGSDEQRELSAALSDVPIIVNADRIAAAASIRQNHPRVNAIVLDDGFQHRRIARDLDLVLIDATNPFGYDHQLPRGLLRESPHALRRASGVIVTRADAISSDQLAQLDQRITGYHGKPPIAHAAHRWSAIVDPHDRPVQEAGRKVLAFCGIGNPQAFFKQAGESLEVIDQQAYDDHYHYDAASLRQLLDRATRAGADALLTTDKDWVKVRPVLESSPIDLPIWRPKLNIALLDGESALRQSLEKILAHE